MNSVHHLKSGNTQNVLPMGSMRRFKRLCGLLLVLSMVGIFLTGCLAPKLDDPSAEKLPSAGRHLKKVLFFWLDEKGQYAQHPSMFERDAYQAFLRENPEEIHGLKVATLLAGTRSKLAKGELVLKIKGPPSLTPVEDTVYRLDLSDKQDRRLRRWIYWEVDPVSEDESSSAAEDKMSPDKIVAWQLTLLLDGVAVDRVQSYLWNSQNKVGSDVPVTD